jgi:tetratricopeptide (TPR) repeat protein
MTASRRARIQFLALGAAIILLAVAGASMIGLGWNGSSVHKSTSGDRASALAGARQGTEAGRLEARAAIRSGRLDIAFDYYRGLDESALDAEDLFVLGSVLGQKRQIVPSWVALEAARRINGTHVATLQALSELQTKLALAMGRERTGIQDAAARVEFLLSVPGGPPLGNLMLGLVRYARDSDQQQEFLDRLMAHDRSALRGLDSRPAAFRLLARLLLEMGRAEEARELLREPAGVSGKALDREAAWLLSRAALQLDQKETADSMLALAGNFARAATSSPEPAPFVGSRRCRDCHLRIYGEQQQASRHALTLRLGSGLKTVPLPPSPVPDPMVPRMTHAFTRKGDDRIDLETRIDDRVIHAIVEYALGSGQHGITMVARDDAGLDRELRISYFPEGQTWGKTKGIDSPPQDAGDHVGLGLSPRAMHSCLNCHATWFRSVDLDQTSPRGPEAQDHGIGCERCHGPGLNHVKAVETGFADLAIAQTSATPVLARLKSCTECHASDGSVQPSDPEFTRAQGTTLKFSKCFTASDTKIGCTTCHDPHRVLETSNAHYESRCLSCHKVISPPSDKAASPVVAGQGGLRSPPPCPVNPTTNCIPCHMPRVEDTSRRGRFTDHHIRAHRGPRTAQAFESRRSPEQGHYPEPR